MKQTRQEAGFSHVHTGWKSTKVRRANPLYGARVNTLLIGINAN
jgi:hypothetical protein